MSEIPRWVAEARAELPVLADCLYLNSGTAGPIPLRSAKALEEEAAYELAHGRGNFATMGRLLGLRERARELVARLLGAEPAEIALTHHTSDGMNIVLWGIDWRRGDKIVTTTLEHDAATVPLGLLRERFGVEVVFCDIGRGERALEALRRDLPGARLLAISHIVYPTGALLPLEEIVAAAHAEGARILVDGAQTCGALPLSMPALGADYYTLSGQKWICGPEGTGALYVRADALEDVGVTFASYFTARHHDFRGHHQLHEGSKRFETGMLHRPSLAALAESLRWIQEDIGVERAWERARGLAARAAEHLGCIDGVAVLTPGDCPSHLVAFSLAGFEPAHLRAVSLALGERGIVIRSIDHPPHALRASFGFFNTEAEVDRFADEIAAVAAAGPPP